MKTELVALVRAGAVVAAVVLMGGGCVSLDKYKQLEFAQRNCEAERERLASELAAAKAQIQDLQNTLTDRETTLANKNRQIQLLEEQTKGIQSVLDRMSKAYEGLASRQIPGEKVYLPPALDTALKDFAAKYPDMVEYDAARGVLKFGTDLLFDLGSDEVKPDMAEKLKELAKIIESPAAADFDVVLVGHTDNIRVAKPETKARFPNNWYLSTGRAISVMEILREDGVVPERLGVMGYGEFRPLAPNTSAENRQKNRRVELFMVPKYAVGTKASETAQPVEEAETKKPAPEK